MKSSFIKSLLVLIASLVIMPHISAAQEDCSDYMLLNNNAQYEIITYNNKDKLESRAMYHVKNVNSKNGAIEATIQTKVFDKRDEVVSEGEFIVGCEKGTIWMDMRSLMTPGMMEAYQNMEVSMEGDKMLYPGNMAVGQKLEDGTMTIKVKDQSSGRNMSTITMNVVDRKVEGKEKVQVPAGTYDSFKISQNTEMENQAMGIKMPGMRMQTIEYYVPKIGMVRSETYRNGKLMSYSVLSKISK
ncbi:TapB family protein [Pontibacter sp. MBLB2868]|uniref:TapB family protein n=1 Tax=Pontibacter sp. MBLB2868 TaxID=3451555 RepID=UPI003F7513F2